MIDMVARLKALDKPIARRGYRRTLGRGGFFLCHSSTLSGMQDVAIADIDLDTTLKAYSLAVKATDMVTS